MSPHPEKNTTQTPFISPHPEKNTKSQLKPIPKPIINKAPKQNTTTTISKRKKKTNPYRNTKSNTATKPKTPKAQLK